MLFKHYLFALVGLISVALLQISAVRSHKWIVYKTPPTSPLQLLSHYGLFQRCDKAFLPFLESQSQSQSHTTSDLGSWSFISIGNQTTLLTSRGNSLPFRTLDIRDFKHEKISEKDNRWIGLSWRCRKFPIQDQDCEGNDEDNFCLTWKSSSYLFLLSLISLTSSVVSLVSVLYLGGRIKRARGWRMVSATMALTVILQLISIVLIIGIFNDDYRFDEGGNKLSTGFFLQIFTLVLEILLIGGLIGTGYHAEKIELGGAEGGDGYRNLE